MAWAALARPSNVESERYSKCFCTSALASAAVRPGVGPSKVT